MEEDIRLRVKALALTSCGVTLADARRPDMPIVYANPAFTDLTGYTSDDILGRNCRLLQGNERDQIGVQEIRSALAERRGCKVVLRNFKKDGSPFWNELTLSPIFGAEGGLTHFIGVQTDVTQREEARLALSRVVADLALAHQDADRFVHLVAKQLEQPLRALDKIGLEWLTALPPEQESQRPLVHQLRLRARALCHQIGEWLEDAQDHTLRLLPEEVPLEDLVVEIVQELNLPASIELRLPRKLPTIYADRAWLKQVFRHVLRGARLTGQLRLEWHEEPEETWRFSMHYPRAIAANIQAQTLWQGLRASLCRLDGSVRQHAMGEAEIWRLEWPRNFPS